MFQAEQRGHHEVAVKLRSKALHVLDLSPVWTLIVFLGSIFYFPLTLPPLQFYATTTLSCQVPLIRCQCVFMWLFGG